MRNVESPGGRLRPSASRHKGDTQTERAPPPEKLSGGARRRAALDAVSVPQFLAAAAQSQRRGRGTGCRVRWWLLLAFLALLPCARAPDLLCCSGGAARCAAPATLRTAALCAPAAASHMLPLTSGDAHSVRVLLFGALAAAAAMTGRTSRVVQVASRAGLSAAPRLRVLLLAACFLGVLHGAHAVVDSRMYTRVACPTVKHRWLAASQYLNSTTWMDGVQSGAQDAALANSDTGTPAVSKPFYDQSSKSVVFSPRSQSSKVGPYVNLQSVHFGTGDFTFIILAKYSAPGSSVDVWPRIFDFSTTGNSRGTYFILTEVRACQKNACPACPCCAQQQQQPARGSQQPRSAWLSRAQRARVHAADALCAAGDSMATRSWRTPPWVWRGRRTHCARTTTPAP